ncbi:MAG: hypothetical protein ACOVNY_06520 [Chitinophagaceae bacterium]
MNISKILKSIVAVIVICIIIFVYWKYFFVYAEGTKAGQLNTFQKKGFVFKTWEGKLIQSGFRANVQSNEFDFSVLNETIAKKLLENSGKEVELHYKRYLGALPWRGNNTYIVDSIYAIKNQNGENVISPK